MKLEEQVCSLELAKKLKEFGVKQESIFYYVEANTLIGGNDLSGYEIRTDLVKNECSAFTSTELGAMLPHILQAETASRKDAHLEIIKNHDNRWIVAYVIEEHLPPKIVVVGATEAEARAQMLIYLIENNFIEIIK